MYDEFCVVLDKKKRVELVCFQRVITNSHPTYVRKAKNYVQCNKSLMRHSIGIIKSH